MNSPSLFDFVQQNALIFSIALISGLGLILPGFKRGAAGASTTEATLLINRENARVLDVRADDEFASGHLPDALHIPLDKLAERVGELQKFKEKPLIVYCATGSRSSRACSELRKQGFTRLYNLSGGVEAWRQAGLPTRKG